MWVRPALEGVGYRSEVPTDVGVKVHPPSVHRRRPPYYRGGIRGPGHFCDEIWHSATRLCPPRFRDLYPHEDLQDQPG